MLVVVIAFQNKSIAPFQKFNIRMAKSQQIVPVKTPIRDWVIQHCMNKVYAPLFGLQKITVCI